MTLGLPGANLGYRKGQIVQASDLQLRLESGACVEFLDWRSPHPLIGGVRPRCEEDLRVAGKEEEEERTGVDPKGHGEMLVTVPPSQRQYPGGRQVKHFFLLHFHRAYRLLSEKTCGMWSESMVYLWPVRRNTLLCSEIPLEPRLSRTTDHGRGGSEGKSEIAAAGTLSTLCSTIHSSEPAGSTLSNLCIRRECVVQSITSMSIITMTKTDNLPPKPDKLVSFSKTLVLMRDQPGRDEANLCSTKIDLYHPSLLSVYTWKVRQVLSRRPLPHLQGGD